jgi:RNA 2',3'-cyclic 3'-phosphodiesterase
MRLFIAIAANEINFDPKAALKKLIVNLNRKELEYRSVPVENYHITLNFLGEVQPEKIATLKEILERVSLRHSFFQLKIEGLGVFPSVKDGRVVWMKVQNSISLRSLQKECEKMLRESGFELEERQYVPHLTILRLRNARNMSDIISPVEKQKFGELSVRNIVLYESKLGGAFPLYVPIINFPLNVADESTES